jgi:hypothetical protein
MMMTGWYDIPSLEQINRMEDEAGLKESQKCAPRSCIADER